MRETQFVVVKRTCLTRSIVNLNKIANDYFAEKDKKIF